MGRLSPILALVFAPGIAFAQLGQGKLWALVTLLGITLGTLGQQKLSARARALSGAR